MSLRRFWLYNSTRLTTHWTLRFTEVLIRIALKANFMTPSRTDTYIAVKINRLITYDTFMFIHYLKAVKKVLMKNN